MPKEATLCHILNDNKLVLKQATRGISVGKWNGPGGKIDDGETPEQCAIRETFEETGLEIRNLTSHGKMNFFFGDSKEPFVVHLFSTKDFSGELKSIGDDGGIIKWFHVNDIPYNDMWDDDHYWMKLMLAGKQFDANFYLHPTENKVLRAEIVSK